MFGSWNTGGGGGKPQTLSLDLTRGSVHLNKMNKQTENHLQFWTLLESRQADPLGERPHVGTGAGAFSCLPQTQRLGVYPTSDPCLLPAPRRTQDPETRTGTSDSLGAFLRESQHLFGWWEPASPRWHLCSHLPGNSSSSTQPARGTTGSCPCRAHLPTPACPRCSPPPRAPGGSGLCLPAAG